MFRLSARKNLVGTGLKEVTPVTGGIDVRKSGRQKWVIFVHGYNNSRFEAEEAWEKTRKLLMEKHATKSDKIVLFFWPGDHYENKLLSTIKYPDQIPIAIRTAKKLSDFMVDHVNETQKPLEISFIAHSLGSLVVLETLRLVRNQKKLLVTDVILMAAAVPEGLCDAHTTRGKYGEPEPFPCETTVLYSLDDTVLGRYFKVGQFLANELPENRQSAVGRTGGPSSGIGKRWSSSEHMDKYDHSDYWDGELAIVEIARVVAGKSLGGKHVIDARKQRVANLHCHRLSQHTIRTDRFGTIK